MKIVLAIVGIVVAGFVLLLIVGANVEPNQPGNASREEALDVSKRIFATCQTQVLGRQQAQGERISSTQAAAITRCVDGMAAAYVEGRKAGQR